MEIILVNDASTDNSLEILRSYETKYPEKIVVIDSQVGKMAGGARNLGLRKARGEFIGFVDSDDFVHPRMFGTMLDKMRENPVDYVCIQSIRVAEDATLENPSPLSAQPYHSYSKEVWKLSAKERLEDADREKLIATLDIGAWHRFFRRDWLLENGLFFPEKIRFEDHYWGTLMLSYVRNFSIVGQILYYYRNNPESYTKYQQNSMSYFDRILDRLRVEKNLTEEFIARGRWERYHDALEYAFLMRYYNAAANWLFLNCKPMRWDIIRQMREYIQEKYPRFRENKYLLALPKESYQNLVYSFDHPHLRRLKLKLKLEGGLPYLIWKMKVEMKRRFPSLYAKLKKIKDGRRHTC